MPCKGRGTLHCRCAAVWSNRTRRNIFTPDLNLVTRPQCPSLLTAPHFQLSVSRPCTHLRNALVLPVLPPLRSGLPPDPHPTRAGPRGPAPDPHPRPPPSKCSLLCYARHAAPAAAAPGLKQAYALYTGREGAPCTLAPYRWSAARLNRQLSVPHHTRARSLRPPCPSPVCHMQDITQADTGGRSEPLAKTRTPRRAAGGTGTQGTVRALQRCCAAKGLSGALRFTRSTDAGDSATGVRSALGPPPARRCTRRAAAPRRWLAARPTASQKTTTPAPPPGPEPTRSCLQGRHRRV